MKSTLAVVACAAVLGLAGTVASAEELVSVNVPFSFFVTGEEMPAGRYDIRAQSNDLATLIVQNEATGRSVFAPVLERLADTGSEQASVVFDKVGGKRFLSEIHIPAKDGFLVGIAKGHETHEVLRGDRR